LLASFVARFKMTDVAASKGDTKATETKAAPPTDDPRLGDVIKVVTLDALAAVCEKPTTAKARVAFVGFPYDEGTQRNNGRVGGADGSAVIRRLGPSGCCRRSCS
jgi:hypothetical protein